MTPTMSYLYIFYYSVNFPRASTTTVTRRAESLRGNDNNILYRYTHLDRSCTLHNNGRFQRRNFVIDNVSYIFISVACHGGGRKCGVNVEKKLYKYIYIYIKYLYTYKYIMHILCVWRIYFHVLLIDKSSGGVRNNNIVFCNISLSI